MPSRPIDVEFALVASGFQTGDFAVRRGFCFGLLVPTVDSCAATLRASWDQTSANYLPLQNAVGSADWTLSVGPGSRAFVIADVHGMFPFPYGRIFLGVAQTAPRTLQIISKTFFPNP
jgi:hypothetical protein